MYRTAKGGGSGCSFFHGGAVAGDGLRRVHASAVAVQALKVGVTQGGEGRYSPGGVERKKLLQDKKRTEEGEMRPCMCLLHH